MPLDMLARAATETKRPLSIRFAPTEIAAFAAQGRRRGVPEPSKYIRMCALRGLKITQALDDVEAAVGHTA